MASNTNAQSEYTTLTAKTDLLLAEGKNIESLCKIYPNPITNNELRIEFSKAESGEFTIFDLQGKSIDKEYFTNKYLLIKNLSNIRDKEIIIAIKLNNNQLLFKRIVNSSNDRR